MVSGRHPLRRSYLGADRGAHLPRVGTSRYPAHRRCGQVLGDDLVAILDAGGYARYDFRTATRLDDLAKVVTERYDGTVAEFGRRYTDPGELEGALGELPGRARSPSACSSASSRCLAGGATAPRRAGGGSGTPPGSDRARHEGRARTHHPPCRARGMRRPRSRVRSGPARARPPPDGRLPWMPSVRRPRSCGAHPRSRKAGTADADDDPRRLGQATPLSPRR